MSSIRQALRRLASARTFSLTVVGLLAIGLGANLTMFSGINSGMFKRQAGVADPDNLYEIGLDTQLAPVSLPEFRAIRSLDAVADAAAIHTQEFGVAHGEVSRLFGGALVTTNCFVLVGVRPHAGRFFLDQEDAPGRSGVVVASHALWSRFLNSDPKLIGGDIRINGRAFQLIGVAPPGFTGTRRMDPEWLWMPLHARATLLGIPRLPDHPRVNWLSVLARPTAEGKVKFGFAIDGLRAEFQKYGGRAGQFRTLPYHPIGAAAAEGEAGGMATLLLFGAWLVLAVLVAVINQTLAARAWPGESAVGKVIRTGPRNEWQVIGVARDSAIARLGSRRKSSHIYVPLQQLPAGRAWLHIRTAGDPMSFAPAVRAAVAELDPYMPVTRVRTLRDQADTTIWSSLVLSTMAAWFAALTLVLSAAGLYAALAHQVTSRTREIGVRIALGAPVSHILGSKLLNGLRLAALGFLLGAPLAWVATLRTPAPAAGPASPVMYGVAAAIIAATAMFPARRAASVDPLVALRQE